MKKIITIFTLAILMVTSVFADSTNTSPASSLPASTSTQVVLNLEKTPKYIFGITKGAITQDKIVDDDPSTTKITNEGTITLNRDGLTFIEGSDKYYLSFLMYEYNKIKISMTLSGNLLHSDYKTHESSTDSDAYQIPYQVKVASGKDTIQTKTSGSQTFAETTLVSSAASKTWEHSYETATTKLGEYSWASLLLTLSPVSGQTTPLKDKATGTFTSTITVTVESI